MGDAPPPIRPRLLVVDDERTLFPILERFAGELGFDVSSRQHARDALHALTEFKPDVAMVDLRMPELSGLDVLKAVKASVPACQVILMTGNATVDSAMEAVKAGALDYVSKPFDFGRLKTLLVSVRESVEQRDEMLRLETDLAERLAFHGMIGRGAEMQQLFDSIQRVAPHVRTVLVTGETGTGKELVARALHREGTRQDRRMVTVNCAAMMNTLTESELFGHVRGAFPGAIDTKEGVFDRANGGTLFLDEIGELPLAAQAKLLRAVEQGEIQRVGSLESRQVDVVVIAATSLDLRARIADGLFRSDLYYRLGLMELRLPPLRDRREDIPYLTAAFVKQAATRFRREVRGVTAGAEALLRECAWPGNVRQLRNVVERACLLGEGPTLGEREIEAAMASADSAVAGEKPAAPGSAPGGAAKTAGGPSAPAADDDGRSGLLATAQRDQIVRALQQSRWNKAAAAKLLGISRRSLYRWLERLDIDPKE